jgi:hypothetical protein
MSHLHCVEGREEERKTKKRKSDRERIGQPFKGKNAGDCLVCYWASRSAGCLEEIHTDFPRI